MTISAVKDSQASGGSPAPTQYNLYVYGKCSDPSFQKIRVAAEYLAGELPNLEATVEGFFETQFEQQLRYIVGKYGGSFNQCKPSAPVVFAETDDAVLFFLNEERFMQWALKRFKYEDNTRLIFYKRISNKTLAGVKASTGRSYFSLSFQAAGQEKELVHFELFDEECPILARNFLDLIAKESFSGHPVHRVKAGAWVQAGDLVDGSGQHSEAASGGLLRDESFQVRHDRSGLLGMSNHGKDTNGSQFYITLKELPFLDGRSVIIGRVIGGMRTLHKINKMAKRNERPVQEIQIFTEPEYTIAGSLQGADKKEGQ